MRQVVWAVVAVALLMSGGCDSGTSESKEITLTPTKLPNGTEVPNE